MVVCKHDTIIFAVAELYILIAVSLYYIREDKITAV
jgi:hypothetical protein